MFVLRFPLLYYFDFRISDCDLMLLGVQLCAFDIVLGFELKHFVTRQFLTSFEICQMESEWQELQIKFVPLMVSPRLLVFTSALQLTNWHIII